MSDLLKSAWSASKTSQQPESISGFRTLLDSALEQEGAPVETFISGLRTQGLQEDAVELLSLARAVASRVELQDAKGATRQSQLLGLPLILESHVTGRPTLLHFPHLSGKYGLDSALELALGSAAGTLRMAPSACTLALAERLPLSEVRHLTQHMATMGDYAGIIPAPLETGDQPGERQTVVIPVVWSAPLDSEFPSAIAATTLSPEYSKTKLRIEEIIEQELNLRDMRMRCTALKPFPWPTLFPFVRRAHLMLDVKRLAKSNPWLPGSICRWTFSSRMLQLRFSHGQKTAVLESEMPDESSKSLKPMVERLAASLGAQTL